MAFKKAVKSQAKLRAALFGPSGAGKTYTALEIASGIVSVIGGNIALIDSERSTASKYADRFIFDQDDLENKDIDEYVKKIKEAAKAGYSVLIIDSLTHAWQMLLDSVEKLAQAKYKGNTWSAWSEGTPEQRRLVDAIVSFPGHIIATMRSKTEWQTTTNDRGKTSPVRVGLAPEQGKGIEYEFDILFEISPDHLAHIIKDRSGRFQDKIIEKPGKDFGRELIAWLNEGAAPSANTQKPASDIPKSEAPKKTLEEQYKETMLAVGNILKSTDDFGEGVFNENEQNEIRAKTKSDLSQIQTHEEKLAYAVKLLEDLTETLHKKLEAPETSPDNTAVENAAPPVEPEPVPAVAEMETAQEKPAEEKFDDGFEDDIPEMSETKKSGKGRSIKEDFNKVIQQKNGTAAAEGAENGELDIF